MKAIISESLFHNLKYGVPAEKKSVNDIFGTLFDSNFWEDEYRRKVSAAQLIFEVERFRPIIEYNEVDSAVRKKLIHAVENNTIQYNPDDVSSFLINRCKNKSELQIAEDILQRVSPFTEDNSEEEFFFLCGDPFYTQQYLSKAKPGSPELTLAILATAGIELSLPAIFCKGNEAIEKIKEKFEQERLDYLDYLTKNLTELHSGIMDNALSVDEIYKFAELEISSQLKIRAKKYEVAVSKADNETKKSLVLGIKDMIPSIGSSIAEGKGLGASVTKGILTAFCGSLFKTKEAYNNMRKKHPEAAFIYQIKNNIK